MSRPDADRGKLAIALGLIVGFMAFEVAVGVIAGSLALLSDAAHMLTDAAAIGLSLRGGASRRQAGEGQDDVRASSGRRSSRRSSTARRCSCSRW